MHPCGRTDAAASVALKRMRWNAEISGNGGKMAEIRLQLKEVKCRDTKFRKRVMREMAGLNLPVNPGDEQKWRKSARKKRRTVAKRAKCGNVRSITACIEEDTKEEETKEEETKEEFIEDGANEMKIAIDKLLMRNCERLSEVLLEKAMCGDLTSTKLLLTLAEGKKPRERVVRLPTFWEVMAKERQWDPQIDPEAFPDD